MSVTLRLSDEIDVNRGDLIASASRPTPTQDLDGMVAWLAERPLRVGTKVLVKHGTATVQAIVRDIHGRLDLNTLAPEPADELQVQRHRTREAAPGQTRRPRRLHRRGGPGRSSSSTHRRPGRWRQGWSAGMGRSAIRHIVPDETLNWSI